MPTSLLKILHSAVLCLCFLTTIEAQVPENFEFLDHKEKCNSTEASVVLQDGILYASKNLYFSSFGIFKANFDNSLDTLYTSNLGPNISLKQPNDSTSVFVLTQFRGYDYGTTGFEIVTIINGKLDTVYSFGEGFLVYDALIASDEFAWFLENDHNDLFLNKIIRSYGVVGKKIPVDPSFRYISSHNENLYLIGGNSVGQVVEDTVSLLLEFDDIILDLHSTETQNYILTSGKIFKLDRNFQNVSLFAEIDNKVQSFRKILIQENKVITLETTNQATTVSSLNTSTDSIQTWEISDSLVTELIQFSDTSTVIAGNSNCQSYLRQVNLDKQIPNEYTRTDVSINTFILNQVNSSNQYDVLIRIENHGVDPIITDLYSSSFNLSNSFDLDSYLDYDVLDPLNPGETRLIRDRTIISTNDDLSQISMSLTGANNRLNLNEQNLTATFFSATDDLNESSNIAIYPNPSSGIINLNAATNLSSASVYNQSGHLVYYEFQKDNLTQLNLKHLESGIYYLHLLGKSNQLSTHKIVIGK